MLRSARFISPGSNGSLGNRDLIKPGSHTLGLRSLIVARTSYLANHRLLSQSRGKYTTSRPLNATGVKGVYVSVIRFIC